MIDAQLPALAFSGNSNIDSLDFNAYRADRETAHRGSIEVKSLVPTKEFRSRSSRLNINGLFLEATSNAPVQSERVMRDTSQLWVLISGSSVSHSKKEAFPHDTGQSAFYATGDTQYFTTSYRSVVRFDIQKKKLNDIYSSILGYKCNETFLERSRSMPMCYNNFSLEFLFKSFMMQIDGVKANAAVLGRLRFDDSLIRMCAAILNPPLVFGDSSKDQKAPPAAPKIMRLCEYLSGNLARPISLTEMEEMSGLSARVLQYSFQNTFGMRPKEWLRKERLHAVRALLVKPTRQFKLTSLSYEYCFASPSDFARYYKQEFGELPSETVRRKTGELIGLG